MDKRRKLTLLLTKHIQDEKEGKSRIRHSRFIKLKETWSV